MAKQGFSKAGLLTIVNSLLLADIPSTQRFSAPCEMRGAARFPRLPSNHILSGADTPSIASPLRITCRTASTIANLASDNSR